MTSLSEKSQVNSAPDKPPPVLPLEEGEGFTERHNSSQCLEPKFGTTEQPNSSQCPEPNYDINGQTAKGPDKPPPALPLEESKVSAEPPNSSQCPKFGTSVETVVEGPIIEFDFESTGTFTDSSEEEAK